MPEEPNRFFLNKSNKERVEYKNTKFAPSTFKHIYNDKRWKAIVKMKENEEIFCKLCEENGFINVPATQTDHIIPLSQGGYPFDYYNTQRICHKCHIRKTNKEKSQ